MTRGKPIRAAVVRSLRELSVPWARPPDPGKGKAAPAGTGTRLQENTHTEDFTPAPAKCKGGMGTDASHNANSGPRRGDRTEGIGEHHRAPDDAREGV